MPTDRSDHQPPPSIADSTYVVVPGDNLWDIAEQHLADITGRPRDEVPVGEVDDYWRRLIELNTPRLASGDPNLIYPGERITLPPSSDD